jgi:two-component system sensor histidine kinase DctS
MEDSLFTGLRARDLQGHITYVNPAFCEMVGYSAEELKSQPEPPPYWPQERVAEYQQVQWRRAATEGSSREGFEAVFKRKNGEQFPVLVVEAPLINAAGVQTGWMSAVVDQSEKQRMEELSRATQERLQATARLATVGEMASLLSHELNQPLAAISSYATGSLNWLPDLTGERAAVVADLKMALGRIVEQSERAGRVIKSVNDFVRRRERLREPVKAVDLLAAILPLVNMQARKWSVRVLTEVALDLPAVPCDRTMVEQVLLNLTRNAMQAMEVVPLALRTLSIRARVVGSGAAAVLEWRITDQGLGISAEVAERLFTPFFTTKAEGMGLGLSLCRTVAEQHGGSLEFEPHPPQGSVFVFTLPVGLG